MTARPPKKSSTAKITDTTANPMWGGQFSSAPAEIMARINASIAFDSKLYAQDIRGSIAHATMLAQTGILTKKETAEIVNGLHAVKAEIETGQFVFKQELEDIHMNIEARLAEIIGDVAGKLHTARSRNDQAVLDFRMYVRDTADNMLGLLSDLQHALINKSERFADAIMPGFTHLQSAQPVTLGHHLMAYVEMIGRDRGRVADLRKRMNECPLGAAALAGTSFPIDRNLTASLLDFDRPTANSLDSVADRDFALEFLSAAAISAVHLSRLAEEFILWSSAPFGFIRFSDLYTTGSSIMPQKRNPDAAELVRGKSGRIFGALMALLTTMKGLPLAYNKDMQEDKEPVFDVSINWQLVTAAMTGMVEDFVPNTARMHTMAADAYATATDLADWLVRNLHLPFRKAHHVTARIVKIASEKGVMLHELELNDMQSVEPAITRDIYHVLQVEHSVASRTSFGGTAPVNVRAAVKAARKKYSK